MKRILIFAAVFCIAFTACTRQENMNTDIFLNRLCEKNIALRNGTDILFDGLCGYATVTGKGGTDVLVCTTACTPSLQTVGGVQITVGKGKNRATDFIALFQRAVGVFTRDDPAAVCRELEITAKSFSRQQDSHTETRWYRYDFFVTQTGASGFIQSKRLLPDAFSGLTRSTVAENKNSLQNKE